jgi:Domain of unknown function (DUF1906)
VSVSRRDVLKFAAATPGLLGLGVAAASLRAAPASASLGTLLDYAAGIIPASQIRAAGAVGAIRYVSDRRPGGAWMIGKPMQVNEARDLSSSGLKIVSCYQYGKGSTSDWLGGGSAGLQHAQRGMQLHAAAGGPASAPIYASIDDDPSYDQYKQHIVPYLRSWESVVGHQRTGVYANSKTIDWALHDGLGRHQRNPQAPIRAVGLAVFALPGSAAQHSSKHSFAQCAGRSTRAVARGPGGRVVTCSPRSRIFT